MKGYKGQKNHRHLLSSFMVGKCAAVIL